MKIMCVGYLHGSGGAERQITMLANELANRGNEVYLAVICEFSQKYPISEKVRIIDLTSVEERKGISIVNRYKALKAIYKEIKPDVSLHFWLQSAYMSAMMKKSITQKIIYSERGDPGDKEYNGLLGFVRKLAFKRIDGFVFQTAAARDYFGAKIVKKSTIIHNAVAIPKGCYLMPCANREKKIVSVGRLHPQKNQKLLIDAFAQIADDIPDYRLEIFGDGELKDVLQQQIDSYGLNDRIFLRGTTPNILNEVYSSAIFVLTSDYEGMPNALIEAMCIGVPCISTDCRPGGAREVITNRVTGVIVPIGDKVCLAKAIIELLINKYDADKIAKAAIERRNNYEPDEIYSKWNRFITSMKEA